VGFNVWDYGCAVGLSACWLLASCLFAGSIGASDKDASCISDRMGAVCLRVQRKGCPARNNKGSSAVKTSRGGEGGEWSEARGWQREEA
jgi:hypothetical protein